MDERRLPYDLGILADVFALEIAADCPHLEEWLTATATLDPVEQVML